MLNQVTIMGRLTADPELRTIGKGKSAQDVLNFIVAVDRNYKDADDNRPTDFIRCTAWSNKAQFIDKYFEKGSLICLTGELRTGQYTDDKKVTHYTQDVFVKDVYFAGQNKK